MAPAKPKSPEMKPGVTGFVQEYNQEPGPVNDLNPAVLAPAPTPPATTPGVTGFVQEYNQTPAADSSTAVAPMTTENAPALTPQP